MANYSWSDIRRIEFTDEDVQQALDTLHKDDKFKEVGRLHVGYTNAKAVRAFTDVAVALDGTLKSDYSGLSIMVPKDADELKEAALNALRHHERFYTLRDRRAEESGVEPQEEQS